MASSKFFKNNTNDNNNDGKKKKDLELESFPTRSIIQAYGDLEIEC